MCACSSGGSGSGENVISFNPVAPPPVFCPAGYVADGDRCIDEKTAENLPPEGSRKVSPSLTASEPDVYTVTLNWQPPEESWQGLSPPFIAGYVINVSEWLPNLGFFQVFQRIELDSPDILTYTLELPGPGRWGITVDAVSITGSERSSNIEVIDIVEI